MLKPSGSKPSKCCNQHKGRGRRAKYAHSDSVSESRSLRCGHAMSLHLLLQGTGDNPFGMLNLSLQSDFRSHSPRGKLYWRDSRESYSEQGSSIAEPQ